MRSGQHLPGFTLVEIAVVLFIIAVLTIVGSVGYADMQRNTRNNEAKEELAAFGRVLVKYKADHGAYPSTTDSLTGEYAVQFSTQLFSTDNYYNLLYCSQSPHRSYVLTAVTKDGLRAYVTNGDAPAPYNGGVSWAGNNASSICGSVLTGATAAGPAGWRTSGEVPTGWRPWINDNN